MHPARCRALADGYIPDDGTGVRSICAFRPHLCTSSCTIITLTSFRPLQRVCCSMRSEICAHVRKCRSLEVIFKPFTESEVNNPNLDATILLKLVSFVLLQPGPIALTWGFCRKNGRKMGKTLGSTCTIASLMACTHSTFYWS
jgi:hypothetical protein